MLPTSDFQPHLDSLLYPDDHIISTALGSVENGLKELEGEGEKEKGRDGGKGKKGRRSGGKGSLDIDLPSSFSDPYDLDLPYPSTSTSTSNWAAASTSSLLQTYRENPRYWHVRNGIDRDDRKEELATGGSERGDVIGWLKRILPDPSLLPTVITLLSSTTTSEEEISARLVDEIFGFEGDGIDKATQVIGRKRDIIRASNSESESSRKHAAKGGDRDGFDRNDNNKGKGKQKQAREWDLEEMGRIRERSLKEAGERALVTSKRAPIEDEEVYPYVFKSSGNSTGGNLLSFTGGKYVLPPGTTKIEREKYEEITIPAPINQPPQRKGEKLLAIDELEEWCRKCFPEYKGLNRLQSNVYPVAYGTSENMLVCAPTGAGKTDVALLAILRAVSQERQQGSTLSSKDFKIVYVAPMKALAAEVVRKMDKRLGHLGIKVRELTGDMHLTKAEIAATHMIVTTPEKWDVVTRKPSPSGEEEDLVNKVKLLIIDEVHLLHEDRGAVIEGIVARTLRQVESSQTLIRIVGLSATLPNYVDVANFLRVNLKQGLFYFDSSFRPVPLEQHFIGVKGKTGSPTGLANLDEATFEKVSELITEGHQVMVFVHARKDTVKTALMLRDKAKAEDVAHLFEPNGDEETVSKYMKFKKEMGKSRNREMKELVEYGFGIHHAGMLRSDRNISEKMFEQGVTKVLVCTATLAWGINLPAYAVVIKGTQIYDSSKGSFMDLSILDVLQIFGRAGRPQYEDRGVGYICTSHSKLDHYVSAITQQVAIESKFVGGMIDALNAEIALGTVSTIDEGVRWLGYTYLFVRMKRNPMVYGLLGDEVLDDPHLGSKRLQLIRTAAKALADAKMITFDEDLGTLSSTELGKIASRYYIRHASIEIFNKIFHGNMSEVHILQVLSSSVEFDQIMVRDSEIPELNKLLKDVPCQVRAEKKSKPKVSGQSSKDSKEDTSALVSKDKVNILLQSYISHSFIEDFALISDSNYVSQNAGRIARALLDIAISNHWSKATLSLISLNKAIEKRMWPFDHPLAQCDISQDILYHIEQYADELSIQELSDYSPAEFGKLIHLNERLGGVAVRAARHLPQLSISYRCRPLTSDLLGITIELRPRFDWATKLHGKVEGFWLWVEDTNQKKILRLAHISMKPEQLELVQEFILSLKTKPSEMIIHLISDRWLGVDQEEYIPTSQILMPALPRPHEPLLDLPLLSLSKLKNRGLLQSHGQELPILDPIQTQAFHAVYHSNRNLLLLCPGFQTWSHLAEFAIQKALNSEARENRVILVLTNTNAPLKPLLNRLQHIFGARNRTIKTPDKQSFNADLSRPSTSSSILVVTPKTVLSLFGTSIRPQNIANLDLVVAFHLHCLDGLYEMAITCLRRACAQSFAETRFVGFSAPLLDAESLGLFLGCPDPYSVLSFHPSARSSSLTVSFRPFTTPHSPALLKSMLKPAYSAMRTPSPEGGIRSVLCFVASRPQCIMTARDLVTQSATETNLRPFIDGGTDAVGDLEALASQLTDHIAAEALTHGIGIWIPPSGRGGNHRDRQIPQELFKAGIIKVLIATREACWHPSFLDCAADLVIVMGAQHVVEDSAKGGRVIRDYEMMDLIQMQELARGRKRKGVLAGGISSEFLVMCQQEQTEAYSRFLLGGIPLESELQDPRDSIGRGVSGEDLLLHDVLRRLVKGELRSHQGLVDYLSWTYLAKRRVINPTFYDTHIPASSQTTNSNGFVNDEDTQILSQSLSQLSNTLARSFKELGCLQFKGGSFKTNAGRFVGGSVNTRLLNTNTSFEVTKLARQVIKERAKLSSLRKLKRLSVQDALSKWVKLQPPSNGILHSEQDTSTNVQKSTETVPISAIKSYASTFPRLAKDALTLPPIKSQSEADGKEWDSAILRDKVLLAGFCCGKMSLSREEEGLENRQVEIILRMVREM